MVKYICVRLLIFISGHYYHTNFYDIIGIDDYSKFYQLSQKDMYTRFF